MSSVPPIILTELQLDALAELVNLGVSNAATSLGEMVREEVALSVPKVSVLTRDQAVANLLERGARQLVAVHQDFEGDIRGRAFLIFPESKSMELVRALVGPEASLEDIVELEQEALAETGNVILNSCLSTMANVLQRNVRISLPEVVHGESTEILQLTAGSNSHDTVLLIYINFAVKQRDIQGFLAMLLDVPALAMLQQLLVEYIQRSTDQS